MKKALGKGLSALIPDSYKNEVEPDEQGAASKPTEKTTTPLPAPASASTPTSAVSVKEPVTVQINKGEASTFQLIPLENIIPNTDQPRQEFDPAAIDELAQSIQEKGVMQPVIVKKIGGNQFMLICGERRFRASRLCGLDRIPAIIKDIASENLLEWALIENIQREDLNPIEEAESYQRLAEDRHLSQEEIAKRVGKDRSTVTNMMRLLRLPEEVRAYLAGGRITSGHARALLSMLTPEHQRQMARRIAEENLSVRQVEAIVTRSTAQKRRAKQARNLAPEIVDLETNLSQHLGTQVKVHARKDNKRGRLEIKYFSLDDLDRILSKLGLEKR